MRKILYFTLPNIFSRGLSFLLFPFLALYLNPQSYGNLNIIILVSTAYIALTSFSINQYIYKQIKIDKSLKTLKERYTITFYISLILFIITIFILLLVQYSSYIIYIYMFLIYFLDLFFCTFYRDYYRATNDEKKFAFSELIKVIIYPVVTCFCLAYLNIDLYSVIIGNFLALMANITFNIRNAGVFFTKMKSNEVFPIKIIKETYMYTFPFSLQALLQLVLNGADKFIISLVLGNYYVGIYTAALTLSNLLGVASQALNNYLIGVFIEARRVEDIQVQIFTFVKLILLLCFTIIYIAPSFVDLFLPDSYNNSIIYLPILLIGQIFVSLNFLLVNILSVNLLDTKSIGYSNLVAAIANIILNIILIPKLGLTAASFISTFSYILLFLILRHKVSKKINVKFFNIHSLKLLSLLLLIYVISNFIFKLSDLSEFILKILILLLISSLFAYREIQNFRINNVIKV
ncbi:oligosaccharide flippase family protein [Fictibacillus sp. KIGAM418]|uniref:Oligosaccharide flippase family protein n=1 Tax=Fictibacillus marinisediminis TaxID=2878389 RepID=A0A9X1XEJ9_9BACL|nr:oligosaccharide flippase family protein [Fictibacillus marinisediminis]MCK6259023.1 oligosaccharide flippase family protein [Fictibacillus marinisediminis]